MDGMAMYMVINRADNVLQRKIEARPCNHYCSGKSVSITHSECVCSLSYPASNEHQPHYIVICGLSGSTTFFTFSSILFTLSHQRYNFRKKVIKHQTAFWFYLQLLSEIFLILRRIQYCGRSFQYSCLLGLLALVTDGLSTYVPEPLAISGWGCAGRDLNEKTLAADSGRQQSSKEVSRVRQRCESESTSYFISRIN